MALLRLSSLSLRRIETFTFLFDTSRFSLPMPVLHSHRHGESRIDLEHLTFKATTNSTVNYHGCSAERLARAFNPVRFAFVTPADRDPYYLRLDEVIQTKSWTRLSHLRLVNTEPAFLLRDDLFGSPSWTISFVLSHPFSPNNQTPTHLLLAIKLVLISTRTQAGTFVDKIVEMVVESEEKKIGVDAVLQQLLTPGEAEFEKSMKHLSTVIRKIVF